jgi:two-component system, NarL family, nitrate/nitrite response regulator NarL
LVYGPLVAHHFHATHHMLQERKPGLNALSGFGLLLLDDHALFRDGLVMALGQLAPECDVAAVATCQAAVTTLAAQPDRFDLVLVDYKLPETNGLAFAAEIRRSHPYLSVGLLSGEDDADLPAQARSAGLVAFLSKSLSMQTMLAALTRLAQGDTVFTPHALPSASDPADPADPPFGLTPRQLDVLALLATGHSNKVIAQALGISPATVKNHLDAIFAKMGVSNRLQAVMLARAALR